MPRPCRLLAPDSWRITITEIVRTRVTPIPTRPIVVTEICLIHTFRECYAFLEDRISQACLTMPADPTPICRKTLKWKHQVFSRRPTCLSYQCILFLVVLAKQNVKKFYVCKSVSLDQLIWSRILFQIDSHRWKWSFKLRASETFVSFISIFVLPIWNIRDSHTFPVPFIVGVK